MIGHFVRALAMGAIVLVVSSQGMAQSGGVSGSDAPSVPSNIEVQDGYSVFFKVHAIGTQNYMCLPATKGSVAWKLVGPQATLFQTFGGDLSQQLATHFLSANPVENGLPRPTWQHSLDSSRVWARAVQSSTDPNYVEGGAIPWLLLTVTGTAAGPTGGSALTQTAFIQRVNTSGGTAPAAGCGNATDVGVLVLVPYAADYYFYKSSVQ